MSRKSILSKKVSSFATAFANGITMVGATELGDKVGPSRESPAPHASPSSPSRSRP